MSTSISLWVSPFGFSLVVSHRRKWEASCRENILRRVSMLAMCRVELIHDLGKNQTKDRQPLQTRAYHFRGAIYSYVNERQKVREIAAGSPPHVLLHLRCARSILKKSMKIQELTFALQPHFSCQANEVKTEKSGATR